MPAPLSLVALAALAAVLLGFAAETAGHTLRGVDRRPRVLAARAGATSMLFLCWFSAVWRPGLAAAACVVTLAAMRGISEKKRSLVAEPLAFSDFALLKQVVRHPDLYYVDARTVAAVAAAAGPVGLWIWAEPSLLPAEAGPAAAGLVLLPSVLALFGLLSRRAAAAGARRFVPAVGAASLARSLSGDEARFGLSLTLLLYLIRWDEARRGPAARPVPALVPPVVPEPRGVVVVQIESFVDPATLDGGRTGPGLARARRRSLLHGALRVPGHGAYTMRSEFAVMSGLDPAEIGFEGFDPYLSAVDGRFSTLAEALRRRGRRTVFVHPFRRTFFGRDRAMPALGFDRLVMEDDFRDAERIGGHVSDDAVAHRILGELDRAGGAAMVFAVTMQNHGPWRRELSPPAGSPFARYRRHLDDADRMIDTLIDGLDARRVPALLCVYGDHPPILDAVGLPTDEPETVYAVVAVGGAEPARHLDMSAAELGRTLRALAGSDASRQGS